MALEQYIVRELKEDIKSLIRKVTELEKKIDELKPIQKDYTLSHDASGDVYTESKKMQDELEPIFHPTQHDESDDIEESKKEEGELTEFEKAELKRKVKKRSVWGDKEWHFFKGEKWEHKYDT